MACGERLEVIETYWSVCRKWIFFYPCKKSRTVTRFRYDFLPWRSRITWPFRCKYEGCCGGLLYRWTYGCWLGTGNSAWNSLTTRTEYFASKPSQVGDCPFSDGQIG
jgi:hypothetical protein